MYDTKKKIPYLKVLPPVSKFYPKYLQQLCTIIATTKKHICDVVCTCNIVSSCNVVSTCNVLSTWNIVSTCHVIQGVFYHWYPPKNLKYKKVNLGQVRCIQVFHTLTFQGGTSEKNTLYNKMGGSKILSKIDAKQKDLQISVTKNHPLFRVSLRWLPPHESKANWTNFLVPG